MALQEKLENLRKALKRKRPYSESQLGLEAARLRRCLNLRDLTGLGLGNTLGIGVYVLVGAVAVRVAGPSIVISFLIAACASLLAGLCYAEFGSRVPRAGSAYIYTYVTIGEFLAFMIGWNMIIEAVFGSASIAKGMSTYMDALTGGGMSEFFQDIAPLPSVFYLSPFWDLFAFVIVLFLAVLLAVGVRQSVWINNVCAIVNIVIIMFMIIAGATKADLHNWNLNQTEIVDVEFDAGVGGFFPYGLIGTIRGAAVCFYGFAGFDIVSSASAEVKDPRRIIPNAIMTVLGVAMFMYLAVAIVVTLMVPYYWLDKVAAVATAFTFIGMDWARYIVAFGGVFGIFSSLFGSMFPLPRLLYAMASDRNMPPCFAYVHSIRRTPIVAIAVPAVIIAIIASLADMEQMILMMCVGTLFSYTVVGVCVIILRYRSQAESPANWLHQLIGRGSKHPCRVSSRCVNYLLLPYIIGCLLTGFVWHYEMDLIALHVVLHVILAVLIVMMMIQPQDLENLPPFKTPLVPVVPCLSIYTNINLMIFLHVATWIRIVVWVIIGLVVYFTLLWWYGKTKEHMFRMHPDPHLDEGMDHHHMSPLTIRHPNKVDQVNKGASEPEAGASEDKKEEESDIERQARDEDVDKILTAKEAIIVEQVVIENDLKQKEAKIIDLLDQVLQAEEESYAEMISLKEEATTVAAPDVSEHVPHRKSLSELSDAESDASFNQVLSKYDVIAQVHREDLPKLNEEIEKEAIMLENNDNDEEGTTEFLNSETNSRTDESGYSDTIDRSALNDSTEDNIPYIPEPPPMDENYFANPYFKKSYSIPSRPKNLAPAEEEDSKPRKSVQSTNSQDDGNIVFGSDRQVNFMSKLNTMLQIKMEGTDQKKDSKMKRSNSTGDVTATNTDVIVRERPAIFLDLNKEILALNSTPNLRSASTERRIETEAEDEQNQDLSMSRDDLKSKLETIFSSGGPKLLKPRIMKSNPPTPEESYQTDTSSSESITKLPKIEKNDTLKRQKDKFSEVLNSFRLSLNKDEVV